MKKLILAGGLLVIQFGFCSELQRVVRAYLDDPKCLQIPCPRAHSYGFSHANMWLLEQIVDCTDSGHTSCRRLNWYLKEMAPLMCQRDAHYFKRPDICTFFDYLLQDQEFIKALADNHFTSDEEAKICVATIAEAVKNTKQ